jgi:hypothetical protein
MKYVSFPWPPLVAALQSKWLAQTLHSNWHRGSRPTILAPSIQLCLSDPTNFLQTAQKTISDQDGVWYDNKPKAQTLKPVAICVTPTGFPHGQLYVVFNCSSSFNKVAVANTEEYRQLKENDTLVASLYIEKCCKFYNKYINMRWLIILLFFERENYSNVYS